MCYSRSQQGTSTQRLQASFSSGTEVRSITTPLNTVHTVVVFGYGLVNHQSEAAVTGPEHLTKAADTTLCHLSQTSCHKNHKALASLSHQVMHNILTIQACTKRWLSCPVRTWDRV